MSCMAERIATLRIVHHRLFGTWPELGSCYKGGWLEWQASSTPLEQAIYGTGDREDEALLNLIHERIKGSSFADEYRQELGIK